MKLNREPIQNWFGFTRRERRSSFILLLIVFLIITLRYAVPERNITPEDVTDSFSVIGSQDGLVSGDMSSARPAFSFDPNTASYDTLIKLGLATREATTLISYRNKGGKFRNPSDIKKVYGIDGDQADRLIPFVKVATDTLRRVRNVPYQRQKLLLELNSCDSASLVRLPGIGPVLSARIIKYRRLLGGFARVEQLTEVYGLPPETYNLIKGNLHTDTTLLTTIKINSADYKGLVRLPYIEKYEVSAILKYRELNGRINGIIELVENKLITKEKAEKISPYLRFE